MTLWLVAAGMSMLSTPAPALKLQHRDTPSKLAYEKTAKLFVIDYATFFFCISNDYYLPTTFTRLLLAASTSAVIFVSERTIRAS